MNLCLGVLNVAYADPDAKGITTTGEVAAKIEDEYDVMDVFYRLHGTEVKKAVADELIARMNDFIEGRTHRKSTVTLPKVQSAFRDYLSRDEWQKETGWKIAAAKAGSSQRFKDSKNKKKKRGARPAFIDTGLYSASFRAWIES